LKLDDYEILKVAINIAPEGSTFLSQFDFEDTDYQHPSWRITKGKEVRFSVKQKINISIGIDGVNQYVRRTQLLRRHKNGNNIVHKAYYQNSFGKCLVVDSNGYSTPIKRSEFQDVLEGRYIFVKNILCPLPLSAKPPPPDPSGVTLPRQQ
jgi:hypothetical protein